MKLLCLATILPATLFSYQLISDDGYIRPLEDQTKCLQLKKPKKSGKLVTKNCKIPDNADGNKYMSFIYDDQKIKLRADQSQCLSRDIEGKNIYKLVEDCDSVDSERTIIELDEENQSLHPKTVSSDNGQKMCLKIDNKFGLRAMPCLPKIGSLTTGNNSIKCKTATCCHEQFKTNGQLLDDDCFCKIHPEASSIVLWQQDVYCKFPRTDDAYYIGNTPGEFCDYNDANDCEGLEEEHCIRARCTRFKSCAAFETKAGENGDSHKYKCTRNLCHLKNWPGMNDITSFMEILSKGGKNFAHPGEQKSHIQWRVVPLLSAKQDVDNQYCCQKSVVKNAKNSNSPADICSNPCYGVIDNSENSEAGASLIPKKDGSFVGELSFVKQLDHMMCGALSSECDSFGYCFAD